MTKRSYNCMLQPQICNKEREKRVGFRRRRSARRKYFFTTMKDESKIRGIVLQHLLLLHLSVLLTVNRLYMMKVKLFEVVLNLMQLHFWTFSLNYTPDFIILRC